MAFSDKIWWTRKARIQTEKRLLANAFQSQVLLLWYSFSAVSVSIYYLELDPNKDSSALAGISWVVFSVLVLCISGFINGLSFKERSSLIKECYETLNGLYHRAKADNPDIESLANEYEQILGVCENHNDDDYYRALCETYLTHTNPKGKNEEPDDNEGKLDRLPTWYHWLSIFWSTVKRWTMLILLYALPIILFFTLDNYK
jgi:hypothetical protein